MLYPDWQNSEVIDLFLVGPSCLLAINSVLPNSRILKIARLFPVPYFPVRSWRSKTLLYWWPFWMSVKSIDPAPLGTYETKKAARTGQRSILAIERENRGLGTV